MTSEENDPRLKSIISIWNLQTDFHQTGCQLIL